MTHLQGAEAAGGGTCQPSARLHPCEAPGSQEGLATPPLPSGRLLYVASG